jgi:hypothetical protein
MQKVRMTNIGTSETELLETLIPFLPSTPFEHSSGMRCLNRGLVPAHLLDCLSVLRFLSCTVISAQKAQRALGVRASVLLAMAMSESAFDVRNLVHEPKLFHENNSEWNISPEIDRWFLKRAKRLTATRPLRESLHTPSTRAYINQICELGFGDSLDADDLWANVENYHLEECDAAGMLPIGEFIDSKFDKVRDAMGNLVAVKPTPCCKLLQIA